MITAVRLSTALELIEANIEGEAGQSTLLEHLRRGEIRAIAEIYIIKKVRDGNETELSRAHNQSIEPSFWIEAGNEKTINWGTSAAAYSSIYPPENSTEAPAVSNDYARVAFGIHIQLEQLRQQFQLPENEVALPPRPRKPHRPQGTGFAKADDAALDRMHELIMREGISPTSAAKRLFRTETALAGAGTLESKISRVVRRYKKKYPRTERNGVKQSLR